MFATKVLQGAWLAVLAMAVLYAVMRGIGRYYARVEAELFVDDDERPAPPARVHAVVLVARVNRPVLRALALASALRPDTVEAVSAAGEAGAVEQLRVDWLRHHLPVPLRVLDAPYHDIGEPLVEHIAGLGGEDRAVVTVFLPEYVVARWWQNLLHNQSALRLKARLLQQPGVVVIDVPYHLGRRERGWLGASPPVGSARVAG